jgi:peroxiredoxin
MKRKDLISAVIGLTVIGLAVFVWLGPAGTRAAPDITLTTLNGEKLAMQSLRGKPVFVTFWATSCTSCIKEIPDMIKLHEAFADQGLEIIAVAMSYDPPNLVKTFTDKRKLPYTVALDLDGSAAKAFEQVRVTPTNFLIAPDGRIVIKNIGLFDVNEMHATIAGMLKAKG